MLNFVAIHKGISATPGTSENFTREEKSGEELFRVVLYPSTSCDGIPWEIQAHQKKESCMPAACFSVRLPFRQTECLALLVGHGASLLLSFLKRLKKSDAYISFELICYARIYKFQFQRSWIEFFWVQTCI